MPTPDAVEELDPRYSADDASPTSWTEARTAWRRPSCPGSPPSAPTADRT